MYKFIIYLVLFFVPLSMVYPQSNQEIDFDFSLCCNQNVEEIDFFEIIKKDSVNLITDIQNYTKASNDFDVIELAQLIVKFNNTNSDKPNDEFLDAYTNLREYALSNENFNKYWTDNQNLRNSNVKKKNLLDQCLENLIQRIEQYIIANLGSSDFKDAIELLKVSKQSVSSKSTAKDLINLNNELIEWIDNNDENKICSVKVSSDNECEFGTRTVQKFSNGSFVTTTVCRKGDDDEEEPDPGGCLN